MSKVIKEIERQIEVVIDPKQRIDLETRLVIESRDNDVSTSLALSQKTMASALDLNYNRGIAYCNLNIGYLKDFQGKKEEALEALECALQMFQSLKDNEGLGYAYKYLCWYYWGLGEMNKALKLMFKGLKINEGSKTVIEGWALFVIGVFYGDMKDYILAQKYLNSALDIFLPLEYEHGIGRSLNGLASIFEKLGKKEKALELGLKSLNVHLKSDYQMGLARSYNDIGSICAKLGKHKLAAENLTKSLEIRKKAQNKQAIITTLTSLGEVYYNQEDYQSALTYLNEADDLASQIDAKAKLIKIKKNLIDIYEELDKPREALQQFKDYFGLNAAYQAQDADSRIKNIESLLNQEKKERQIEKNRLKHAKLKLQKQRVEMLFGQQVSSKVVKALLKKKEKNDVQKNEASIMFLDIRNFTHFARGKDPAEVIKFQNNVFSPLIDIITDHNGIINQILGDGFMASFGIPIFEPKHAQNAFNAGLKIIEDMKDLARKKIIPETMVGIGLHSGKVISGNIGNEIRKQFSIAGDTVILAARLEQLNKQYKSQFLISKEVYDQISNIKFTPRSLGKLSLKGFEIKKEVFQVI